MSDQEKEPLELEKDVSLSDAESAAGEDVKNEEVSETEEKQEERKPFSIVRELIVYALIIVLCVTVIPKYVLQRTQVDGESMEDTLHNYDNLLVEKVTYHFKDPDRFDIVTLYPNGKDRSEYYIKRIIGLPGENVRIEGNKIYINGKLLKESYGKDAFIEEAGIAEGDGITLKEDEFFVMGDNRNNSVDSRFEGGPVKKENIDGHAIFRICSFKEKKDGSRGAISFSKTGVLN